MLARLVGLIALLLLPAVALAAPTRCPEHFLNGQAPDLTNPKLTARTRPLCYSAFAVLHSGVTRTPLWSAEHLTRDRVEAARGMVRVNTFHADPNLSPNERAELSDYARSGFDRGHMAPSGDMPDDQSQDESFSLANMIPQNPDNNRHLWERIETAVRNLTLREGELYVVTGPIFRGENLQALKGRVLVPTEIFKAIYDPKRNGAAAYVVPNAAGNEWRQVSILELQQLAGIDVFPGLPQSVKESAMPLPKPGERGRRRRERVERQPSGPAPRNDPDAVERARRKLMGDELR
jgi:endonuclease G